MKKEKRKNNNKNRSKNKKYLIILIIAILIFILTVGSAFAYKIYKNGGGLQGMLATAVGHNEEKLKNLPVFNFLILGESQNLTDTIMVCSYNPKTQQATILSVPRDTFTGKNVNKATAYNKINAVYQGKHAEEAMEAINTVTGLDIKHYLIVDTKALIELVDELGGVYFDVPINMNYDDSSQDLHINLKAGYQLLDGAKAEQVVRFRHNNNGSTYPTEYGAEDIGRMRTQREFLSAILSQTLKPQNIFKIKSFLDIAYNNVKTNIDLATAKDYIPYAVNFNTQSLTTLTLPGQPELHNGVWLYIADKTETKNIVNQYFIEQQLETTTDTTTSNIVNENTSSSNTTVLSSNNKGTKNISVEILNGSNNTDILNSLTKILKNNGYTVSKVGSINVNEKTTIINRTNQADSTLNDLKTILKTGTISSGNTSSNIDITIILGKDYNL